MRRKLKSRLDIVWGNKPPKRYLPRSLDGGTGWGVFDRRANRFLSDTEVTKTDKEALSEVYAN
jgi:hypothetical protein